MRLERLEISGFMNFRAPAVLDLRDIPPGLVSITGTNGHGKTRLLDAGPGAVYGLFPSRDGVLADYATERDAYVEALFAVEGRGVYRSRYNVDGQKRNSDAVLELVQPDGTRVSLNDGKVTTHRDAVAAVFPSKELLLASAFAAQNRAGSFVSLGKKDRKDLFGALLGLAHYERMAATAKTCFDVVEATRARLNERRTLLAEATTEAVAVAFQARANALQAEGGQAELRRGELRQQIEGLDKARPALIEQAQAHLAGLAKHQTLTESIGARTAELWQLATDKQNLLTAYGEDLRALDQRTEAAVNGVAQSEGAATREHAALVLDLDERIAGNQTLSGRADAIRAAAAAKVDEEARLVTLRAEKDKAADQREQALEQVKERERRHDATAPTKLSTARLQVETLAKVPCGGAGDFSGCKFLEQAQAAQSSMPVLEAAIAQNLTLIEGITLWNDEVARHGETVKAKSIAIAQVEQRIKQLAADSKYLPELEATAARIEGYEREKQQAGERLDARLRELADHRAAIQATFLTDRDALVAKRDQRIADLNQRKVTGDRALADLEHQRETLNAVLPDTEGASRQLVLVDEALTTARAGLLEVEKTLAAVAAKREALDGEREAFTVRVRELSDVSDRLRTVEDRLLVWQLLLKALGRDGLPTLEIAASGPTVTNLVNDLLAACFGSRFSVELVTQEPKADGKGLKETFDLKVFDNEHGGDPRDIADLSGGERVIVDEALRAALALYVNSRNVAPIRTCWRDETTGALDPENATRYVAMLRKLHELGGFAHVIYVTHNPDAAALADTQIVVTNGQPDILRRAA